MRLPVPRLGPGGGIVTLNCTQLFNAWPGSWPQPAVIFTVEKSSMPVLPPQLVDASPVLPSVVSPTSAAASAGAPLPPPPAPAPPPPPPPPPPLFPPPPPPPPP